MEKNSKIVYKVVITAIFAALSFAGTMINIQLPMEGMVHLGNFVCILAGLLCGGVVGGIAGSLGMGAYDLIYYSAYPTTIVRTFILKFIMGFVAGYLFRFILKKENPLTVILLVFGIVFSLLFGITLYLTLQGSVDVVIGSATSSLTVSPLVPIFAGIFALGLLMAAIFSRKIKYFQKSVLFTATVVIIINIMAEFILRIIFSMMFESLKFQAALITSVVKLPASLITGVFTVVLVTLIFPAMFKAVKNLNKLNDIEYSGEI